MVYVDKNTDSSVQETEYQSLDFEAQISDAKEIVTKVNNILELRFSPLKQEYEAHMDKKKDTAGKSNIITRSIKPRRNTISFGAIRQSFKHNPPSSVMNANLGKWTVSKRSVIMDLYC